MRFRAFLSLALYALAFVLGPGLHHLLPVGACTDCAGEHAAPEREPSSCCGHVHETLAHETVAHETVEHDSAPGDEPRPADEDHEPSPDHCPDHCGVCRVVHGTSQALPDIALVEGFEAEALRLSPLPASEPRAVDARPRAARAPPLLG
jgi:hypothetical protein